jgi:hypothetical protein
MNIRKNTIHTLLFCLLVIGCPAAIEAQQAEGMIDSIKLRQQFIQDSITTRVKFVQDSVRHHQAVLDSLTFLQEDLQVLLNAYFRTVNEDIILHADRITIIGDSVLSNYVHTVLPFNTIQPFTPWKVRLNLTGKSIRIGVDKKLQRITSITAPFMKCSFTYNGHLLIINERNMVETHGSEQFYTTPYDSVFFDNNKRVTKIKRYTQYYTVVNRNQRGTPLFLHLSRVMQYEYGKDDLITRYRISNSCERWKSYDPEKICSSITYSLTSADNLYRLTRRNEPANNYSDGTFTFEFTGQSDLKSISFQNLANTENWQRVIELNKDGNVSCYLYKIKDAIRQSLCLIYHLQEPNAKYPVETITTTFEDDGISYNQTNNTTGKSRTRDRLTLEWSPWR